jgi:hypothetical protein
MVRWFNLENDLELLEALDLFLVDLQTKCPDQSYFNGLQELSDKLFDLYTVHQSKLRGGIMVTESDTRFDVYLDFQERGHVMFSLDK